MTYPANVIYDFIPATGAAVAATDPGQRLIADVASCNECHGKLGGIPGTESQAFHGGSRQDPKYCVMCHTDQRKFGANAQTSTNNTFDATKSATVFDGVNVADLPVPIHRVHKGEMLVKKGYNFGGVLLNETKFPQDIRNCTKCHDDTAPKVAPQGSNYKNVPSRLACGACHDGIDFAKGTGTTNAGATTGHAGLAQPDDTLCATCHKPEGIVAAHVPVSPPNPANSLLLGGTNANTNAAWIASSSKSLPAGAIQVSYDIKSVSRNATTKNPSIVFRMLQNGVAVPFNTYSATGKTEIWDNFMGSPSVYFVYSVPQDGITAPSDFNVSASGYIRSLWNGIYPSSANAASKGTLTGPDASGYYTATIGAIVPDNAVMLTGGIGYTYGVVNTLPLTQTNLADYPVVAATAPAASLTAGMLNKTGGLIVIATDNQKVATNYTARRAVVEDKRCNACHEELGVFTEESFHAGQRNDGTTCSWCHKPNQTSSGWSADSAYFVHAIHGASKRGAAAPFTWHATTTTSSFANVGYPGVLANCETCHLPGTY
ncbi:MAG: OmcA/MtrC family decaheme c-type cytochrome, partial [Burkholderiales bacterium]